jgi:hypothetical protein
MVVQGQLAGEGSGPSVGANQVREAGEPRQHATTAARYRIELRANGKRIRSLSQEGENKDFGKSLP